jgi:cell wall-associated NlpC family hydrolase
VLENLNLRYSPSTTSGIAAVAPSGTVVEITGGVSNGYYPVNWDGLQGYMHGDYLSATNADLSQRGGSGDPGTSNGGSSDDSSGGSSSGSASGQAMVNYAMQYLGYPYVWATHGPSSFDCSGFTYWVTLNVLGIDIGAGTATQIGYGTPVSQSQLQPGDLVFFQNTYTWGLSHVGIYIGNGQFIHAENETTGVKISSLTSTYYASRWYGARRIAN